MKHPLRQHPAIARSARVLGVLLCLASMGAWAGDIYKWVDSDGNVHFGDRPAAGAEPVDVRVNAVPTVSSTEILERVLADRPLAPAAAASSDLIIYTTSRCGYCRQAKAHFASRGIAYSERNIERSSDARAAFQRLGGNGVPLIVMGDRRMSGFSPASFDRWYNAR